MISYLKKIINKTTLPICFYSIYLLFVDAIFHIFFRSNNLNYFHIIFQNIFIGLIISTVILLIPKKIRFIPIILIDIILLLYTIVIFIIIFGNISFGIVYTSRTILNNIINVINQYHEDIIGIVVSNIAIISILFISILFLIIFSFRLYLNIEFKPSKKSLIIQMSIIIISFLLSIFTTNNNYLDFATMMTNNGLKYAILNDFIQKNDYSIDNTNMTQNETVYSSDKNEYEYNMLDLDFNNLIANEKNVDINNINKYINSISPTKKNKYTGIFKNKNLIMICAESWNSNIIDESLFPTMYRLVNNGIKLDNFYQVNYSSTLSGEFAFLTGFIPISCENSFMDSLHSEMGFSIPKTFKRHLYNTFYFHNGLSTFYSRNLTHGKHLGFDSFITNDTGLSNLSYSSFPNDEELFDCTFDIFKDKKPFLAHYMTYTGHMPYTKNKVSSKTILNYYDLIDKKYNDKYSESIKVYLAKNLVLENALKKLLNNLKENNLLEDTVICMVPDHYPYGLDFSKNKKLFKELYKLEYDENFIFQKDKTNIILWSYDFESNNTNLKVSKYCQAIDLAPTLFNLFGIDYDSRVYPGKDILSDAEMPVIYLNGNFITSDYNTSLNNADKKYNDFKNIVHNTIKYCNFNIKFDYYSYLVSKMMN